VIILNGTNGTCTSTVLRQPDGPILYKKKLELQWNYRSLSVCQNELNMMHLSDEDIELCSVDRFGSPWQNRISSTEFGSKFNLSSIVSLYLVFKKTFS